MAAVVERATGRAECVAFARALSRYGVPAEVITDNGKQFTNRFGRGGEVLFDRICRHNGIGRLLTEPSSPNQNGKVFHGTFRPDSLDDAVPFDSVGRRRPSTSGSVEQYNTDPVPVPLMRAHSGYLAAYLGIELFLYERMQPYSARP